MNESSPLLIAEMSGNHNGSYQRASDIVRAAADAGAGAVKLQTFTPETLSIDSDRPEFFISEPDSPWFGRRLWELYAEAATPWEWHEPLFHLARDRGLQCISAAFDETAVAFLVDLEVDAIKIASFEMVHIPLIRAAARTDRPLIMSTGMCTIEEIDLAVETVTAAGHARPTLLKCTSAYPSEPREANLATMADLRRRYVCDVGLSDHSPGVGVAVAAVALGATVIEKHLTLSRADGGVDAEFSMEPKEFEVLAEEVARASVSLGTVRYGPLPSETASLQERPSIYVVEGVRRGDSFTSENLRCIRPGAGIAPHHFDAVMGSRAAVDIAPGTPLTWDLVAKEGTLAP
jgi:N-acetylneuraminate synthase